MLENEISKKRKNSAETILKFLQKNTHWSVETQLFGKFTNVGETKTKRNLNENFSLKSFRLFQTCPTLSNVLYFLQWKFHVLVIIKKCPFLQHLPHFVMQRLTSNRTIDNFICTTQMTNTFAFTININEKSLLNSVGCVGSVGQILAWVVWVAWVHKFLAWMAWVKKMARV